MCGCNNPKVSFAKANTQPQAAQFVVPAPKRKVTTSCDTVGTCGIVQSNSFTTSEGHTANFNRNSTTNLGANFPKESMSATVSASSLTSIGLRQLAEEFASMADELDGEKTIVTLAGQPVVKRAKRKAKGAKKLVKAKVAAKK